MLWDFVPMVGYPIWEEISFGFCLNYFVSVAAAFEQVLAVWDLF